MSEVQVISRVLQIAAEGTLGVAVPTTKQLQTIKAKVDPKLQATIFQASGQQYGNVATIDRETTDLSLDFQPSFGEIVYILTGLFGAATITTPGGGTNSRQWQWILQGNVFDAVKPFTFEHGDSVQATQVPGAVFTAANLKFDRSKISGTAKVIGQQTNAAATLTALTANNDVQTITPTSPVGTWTVSFRGVATAGLAANITKAALQTALQGLSTIGAGNVVVTGTDGGPWVLTFQGNLGNQLVDVVVLTQPASSGSVAVVHTTPGVSISPEPVAQPLVPNQVDVWIDSSFGALGTTQALRDFTAEWDFSDKYQPFFPLNSALGSYAGVAAMLPKPMTKLALAFDATGRGLLTAIRNGTRQFVRIKATGPVIEGTIHYSITIDQALNIQDVGGEGEFGGIYTREFTGQLMSDFASGRAATITVVNALAAL